MHAGIGTHMDAPSHCIAGGKCIHNFDVNDLILPCVVINVAGKYYECFHLIDLKDGFKVHKPF
jgi:kynurenine formamidase